VLLTPSPFPIGISVDVPWGGHGFIFWNYTIHFFLIKPCVKVLRRGHIFFRNIMWKSNAAKIYVNVLKCIEYY